ncbi:hypothetical protein RHMOL_Rhmol01G0341500 [Rhododendron molle]|uniref:Uncharacterized protein n=1 Tax=Rhododendron molle TaxID=49168 RepID=A0ACC0Q8D1_RHOML|nr:hypothetical protein RHMOL_Rhmol01G0341500 [Rhododendron molle]
MSRQLLYRYGMIVMLKLFSPVLLAKKIGMDDGTKVRRAFQTLFIFAGMLQRILTRKNSEKYASAIQPSRVTTTTLGFHWIEKEE